MGGNFFTKVRGLYMKKKKKSKYYEEYMRERKRIQNYMSRKRSQGFDWFDFKLPAIPKKIKPESISRLKKMTPTYLMNKAVYPDKETGVAIPAKKELKRRKKEAVKKRQETIKRKKDINSFYEQSIPKSEQPASLYEKVISEVRELLAKMAAEEVADIVDGKYRKKDATDFIKKNRYNLLGMVDENLLIYGKEYAKYLESNKGNIEPALTSFFYGQYLDRDIKPAYAMLVSYFRRKPITPDEAIVLSKLDESRAIYDEI